MCILSSIDSLSRNVPRVTADGAHNLSDHSGSISPRNASQKCTTYHFAVYVSGSTKQQRRSFTANWKYVSEVIDWLSAKLLMA